MIHDHLIPLHFVTDALILQLLVELSNKFCDGSHRLFFLVLQLLLDLVHLCLELGLELCLCFGYEFRPLLWCLKACLIHGLTPFGLLKCRVKPLFHHWKYFRNLGIGLGNHIELRL